MPCRLDQACARTNQHWRTPLCLTPLGGKSRFLEESRATIKIQETRTGRPLYMIHLPLLRPSPFLLPFSSLPFFSPLLYRLSLSATTSPSPLSVRLTASPSPRRGDGLNGTIYGVISSIGDPCHYPLSRLENLLYLHLYSNAPPNLIPSFFTHHPQLTSARRPTDRALRSIPTHLRPSAIVRGRVRQLVEDNSSLVCAITLLVFVRCA